MENNPINEDSVEMTVDDAKAQALFYDAMLRLESNPDFQTVILSEYLTNEPVRLATLLGLPFEHLNTEAREDVVSDIEAIGRFKYWMKALRDRTQLVKDQLDEYIEAIDDAQQEEA